MKAKRTYDYDDHDRRIQYVSIEEAEKLEVEIKELERNLFGILAIIHRDGGQHTQRFGRNTSVSDAIHAWTARQTEIEELKASLTLEQKLGLEVMATIKEELTFARRDRRETYKHYAKLFKDLAASSQRNVDEEKREFTSDPESRKERENAT